MAVRTAQDAQSAGSWETVGRADVLDATLMSFAERAIAASH